MKKKPVKIRNFRKTDWQRFHLLLLESLNDWQNRLDSKDVDLAWNCLLRAINSSLDVVAPYRTVSTRNFISSPRVRIALRYRRRFFRAYCDHPSIEALAAYIKSTLIADKVVNSDLRYRENQIIHNKDQRFFGLTSIAVSLKISILIP